MSRSDRPSFPDSDIDGVRQDDAFLDVVRHPSGVVDVFSGALSLVLDARPDASLEAARGAVDRWSERLSRRIRHAGAEGEPLTGMLLAARILFEEAGLEGDVDAPLDTANCDLDLVLERRLGIPVTLGILLLEVSRRAGLPTFVASYPTRLLVALAVPPRPLLFDPFRGGRLVLPEWCQGLVDEATGRCVDGFIAPLPPERLLERLVSCWKHACLRASDLSGAIRCQGRLIDLRPHEEAPLTERARLLLQAGDVESAVLDLERAASWCRDQEQVAAVRRELESVRRRAAAC